MKRRHKNILLATFTLFFCFFNLYKSLNNHHSSSSIISFLKSPWQHPGSINTPSNQSEIKKIFHGDHVSVRTKLLRMGRPHNQSLYKSDRVVVGGVVRYTPFWQSLLKPRRVAKGKDMFGDEVPEYHFLVVVLQVRLYSYDKAKWSVRELKQWLHHLLLAGVDHFFICDHFRFLHESIHHLILKYEHLGLITYLPWSAIRNPMDAQVRCYQRLVKRYKKHHVWQMAIDLDEYPFAEADMRENFLVRYLESIADDVSEVSMANYLMLGKGDRGGSMVVRRINRMTKHPANLLSKPVYRPDRVASAAVHHNHMAAGRRIEAPHDSLKMLHYWGGRDQGWGEDTKKTLEITTEMNLMRDVWADKIENSLLTFGESSALSNLTGP